MFHETVSKVTHKGRGGKPARAPGVHQAAKALGCTKGHLWHVIVGLRVSPKLLAKYKAWMAAREASQEIAK